MIACLLITLLNLLLTRPERLCCSAVKNPTSPDGCSLTERAWRATKRYCVQLQLPLSPSATDKPHFKWGLLQGIWCVEITVAYNPPPKLLKDRGGAEALLSGLCVTDASSHSTRKQAELARNPHTLCQKMCPHL